ncbi:energy transducer TonB [Robiginitalea sp. M366]|uniref:energy transducer TonB n=1 Tax=Robiginitalea aestuariiviva TaxID=3036903 RepID=UPI00240D1538|nr:energy transducer TonB [Robiginitalea aestuariiviva]MDG1572454.1 energy transducer TonB [Robiginitalea aestuariiviva]
MRPKKNPQADLNRDSGLYFVIGLAVVLFATWRALEWKSYDSVQEEIIQLVQVDNLDEKVPVTEQFRTPPPPPPPAAPEVIEVIEDTEEIEETVIESTEISQETVIADVDLEASDIDVLEEEEEISVPFAIIEEVPVFPGCEGLSRADQRTCFQEKIQEHVAKNFRYPETALELGIQGRVYVMFAIGTDGKVTDIVTRGPDRILEQEARRIIASLPQMTPGKQRSRKVKVPYSIPINFKLM